MRVLIVEDDVLVQEVLVEGLQRVGHQVRAASRLPDAATLLHEFSPDVLVVDVDVSRADGLSWLERMLDGEAAGLRAVVVSGLPLTHAQEAVVLAHGLVFMLKPFRISELESVLRRMHPEGDLGPGIDTPRRQRPPETDPA